MNILCIIPARGGSQGVPRKNIKRIAGKPLIAWTIELALDVKGLSDVVVSTDDVEIARIAEFYGAKVPFVRPAKLSNSTASGEDVLVHALVECQRLYGMTYDWVLYLQPTSPLRGKEDILGAINMAKKGVDAIVSVNEVTEPPQWMKRIEGDGTMVDFLGELSCGPDRQSLELPYILNGAIYMVRSEVLLQGKGIYGGVTKALKMSKERSVDIDTPFDFRLAEILLSET